MRPAAGRSPRGHEAHAALTQTARASDDPFDGEEQLWGAPAPRQGNLNKKRRSAAVKIGAGGAIDENEASDHAGGRGCRRAPRGPALAHQGPTRPLQPGEAATRAAERFEDLRSRTKDAGRARPGSTCG